MMNGLFIDAHCHLEMCGNAASVIGRARSAGVRAIVANGVKPEANRKVLEFARQYKEVKAALGLYPIDALAMKDEEIDKELNFMRLHREKIAALGEIGLDFKEDEKEHEQQKYIFRKIVKLALELDKSLIVHSRKAEQETVELLEQAGAKKVVMHCFCGKWSLVERICRNGWLLTVPTHVTHSEQFQRIARELPLSALLCETDAPFLHPDKEKNNEPALVVRAYEMIAQLKGIPLEDVQHMLARNFERVIGKI